MNVTTRIELTILFSGLLACSVKGSFGDSDTAPTPDGTTGYGDSEASAAATEGGASISAGPASDTDVVSSSVPAPTATGEEATSWGETTGGTTEWVGTTDWAGTTLVETGAISDTDDTGVTTTPYTTGEPEPCEGEAVPLDVEVLSYVESQVDGPDPDGTTGEGDDPNLLYIRFSDQTFTCADPHDRVACGEHWDLSLRLPAEFQTPGLYALDFAHVKPHAFGTQTGPDVGSEDCDGSGSQAKGTVQIIAIDEDKVVGRLCHVQWSGHDDDFELDGSFIAPRCPQ